MKNKYSIAAKIKKFRLDIGWSQSELARQSGVTSAAISRIEKDDGREPSLVVIKKLANALNISVARLMNTGDKTGLDNASSFFAKFRIWSKLSTEDQKLILVIAERLQDKN